MEFLKSKYNQVKKVAGKMLYPNDYPTDIEKKAFDLLKKGEVEMFIDLMENAEYKINPNITDNKLSLLMVAQDVANDTTREKKLIPEEERIKRAIQAIKYLLKRGVDINYADKYGAALQGAVHWENYQIAELLIEQGADVNLTTRKLNFSMNPLLSATFKNNIKLMTLLVAAGASIERVFELSEESGGFKVTEDQKEMLQKISNIALLIRKREGEKNTKKKGLLSMIPDNQFEEMLFLI